MIPFLLKSPQAFADLDTIAAYIAQDNPQAALRFLDILEEKFRLLAESPGIGRLRPELAEGLRAFPAGEYVLYYRQLGSGVEVVRVLHSARDTEALFLETASHKNVP